MILQRQQSSITCHGFARFRYRILKVRQTKMFRQLGLDGSALENRWSSVPVTREGRCATVCPWHHQGGGRLICEITLRAWLEVAEKVREFARREGPPEHIMKLALGQVNACPFPEQAFRSLEDELIASLAARGKILKKLASDRTDLPIDFRFLELLLDASGDPEVGLGASRRV